MQAAEQAQVESEAKLIAFDRQNHMGISSKTAQKIQEAITAEAATMHDAKGAKAVVNIKDNEEKMKQMRVSKEQEGEGVAKPGRQGSRWPQGEVGRGEERCPPLVRVQGTGLVGSVVQEIRVMGALAVCTLAGLVDLPLWMVALELCQAWYAFCAGRFSVSTSCFRAVAAVSFCMQAFWLPSQQSESKDLMQKPDSSTYCPASGKKLRLKDCVAVKFTRVRENEQGMYMDPVTLETFTNATKLVVIVPTGGAGRCCAGV